PSFIASMRERRPAVAARLEALKRNIDRPLSAILSLNTIAHTVGAAGVGSEAARLAGEDKLFGTQLSEGTVTGIASAIMTLLILILSEIIPKTIGALHWRSLCPFIASSVNWLIIVLFPLVWVSEKLTKVLSGGKVSHAMTREEFAAMAQMTSEQGILDDAESKMLRGLLNFGTLTASDVMTPRTVVVALNGDTLLSDIAENVPGMPVSRIPVFSSELDDANQFVLRTDLMIAIAQGETNRTVNEFARPLLVVNPDTNLQDLFERLMNNRSHIALVSDQYGSALGVVTLEDLVETILDMEIVDERDREVDMQALARKQWKDRAAKAGLDVDSENSHEE
ncbi:MAG: CNNM domain-containing protein, partial [Planctomycetota bacterium]